MEAMFNFIPAPIALVLMFIGFAALAVGAIRLGYKQYVKQWALELVTIAEDSIMGSGQGAKKKAQVFAALRGALQERLRCQQDGRQGRGSRHRPPDREPRRAL